MIQDVINKNYNNSKRNFKLFKKILLIFVYIFLLGMAILGCAQQIFDKNVFSFNAPGGGLEFSSNNDLTAINSHQIIASGNNGSEEISNNHITNFKEAISHGPFYGFFVFPLAMLSIWLVDLFGKGGGAIFFTIVIIVILIRTFSLLITINSQKKQSILQNVQYKVAEIKSKYEKKGKLDTMDKQRQQIEIMRLYRKIGISPLAPMMSMLITLPFLYTMYRVFVSAYCIKNGVLFKGTWCSFEYQTTISSAIFSLHEFQYLIPAIIVIPIQVCAVKITNWLTRDKFRRMDQAARDKFKKTQMISNIMVVAYIVFSIFVPFSLSIYWMLTGIYTICQTIFIQLYLLKPPHKRPKIFQRKFYQRKVKVIKKR